MRPRTRTARYQPGMMVDLATPPTQSQAVLDKQAQEPPHVVQPPPQDDHTVAKVAAILAAGYAINKAADLILPLLSPFGVTRDAVVAAIGLANNGTAATPNARHRVAPGSTLDDTVKAAKSAELYFRAAYLANAAKRITLETRNGQSMRVALQKERTFYHRHEKARAQRLDAVSRVSAMAALHGPLLGWYKNPLLNNESECNAADGCNFLASTPPVIGYPGTVHAGCGCIPGPPIEGAPMVDTATKPFYTLGNSKPKFKLKPRRTT